MNSIKTIILSVAGIALAHTASAQTVIRIAGSNGDRQATNAAIQNLLVNETYVGIIVDGTNGTPSTSNFGNFVGGTIGVGGPAVTVKTAYIGATGGIKAVAGLETVRFLPTDATGTLNPTPLTNANPHEDAVPDFGVSTNFQSTSPYEGDYNGKFYKTLTETLTSVVPLRFVASTGFPATNLTTSQAQSLYLNGFLPLSFFTGLQADHNKTVFAIGRNTDAGQRYGHLSEIGLGVNAVVKHYQPTISAGHVTGHILWPVETISGVSSGVAGNGGFSSGALLRAALPVVLDAAAYQVGNPAATAGYYIGYVTPSDANTVLPPNNTAVGLSWNGVPYTQDNVRQGLYTAWLYTRVIYSEEDLGDPGTLKRDFADAIATNVITTAGTTGGGILLGTMVVERNAESAPVTPNEFF